MSWTSEKEQKLRQLWKEGHSGSQIAVMLGNTTRNAVIGKAHRLKLEARTVSKKSETNANKQTNNFPKAKTQKLGRKARFKALLLDPSFPPEQPTKLIDLTDEHCRWPLGEKMKPAIFFCGRKIVESKNISYISNKCIKQEYQRLFLKVNPVFPALKK